MLDAIRQDGEDRLMLALASLPSVARETTDRLVRAVQVVAEQAFAFGLWLGQTKAGQIVANVERVGPHE